MAEERAIFFLHIANEQGETPLDLLSRRGYTGVRIDKVRARLMGGKEVTTAVHLSGAMVPAGVAVDVEIKIHTRLNISPYVAKQKANMCLALHCGQSFCIDEPILQVGERIAWLVPVWLSTPQEGRKTKIGELIVDAQTGEVLESGERCRVLRQIANALLHTMPAAPPGALPA